MKGQRKVATARTKLCLKLGNIPLEGRLVRISKENLSGLSQFSPEGNPIGYQKIDKVTGETVANGDILKGKKIGDTVVTFTNAELTSAYANRQAEIGTVKVEDVEDIPARFIKSIFAFRPENETFWGLIGGRMAEGNKQLRFVYVEGRQERTAIMKLEENTPIIYVLYFPTEVADLGTATPPVCKPELAHTVDTLFTGLANTELSVVEETRNVVIEQLIEAKLTGVAIPVAAAVQIKVQKGKSVEELLNESIAMVNAK